MARKLTVKQKNLITTYSQNHPTACSWNHLSHEFRTYLLTINDYETLWSDTERYISDLKFGNV